MYLMKMFQRHSSIIFKFNLPFRFIRTNFEFISYWLRRKSLKMLSHMEQMLLNVFRILSFLRKQVRYYFGDEVV